mmetsp:Transcript_86947/g.158817  ORF Transcript_86947/g.158817 Transcript_86947/m.158817 type:complete len:400 (+) Transcript_86947:94-1293(+)
MWNTSGWLLPLACVLSTAVRSGDAALAAQNEALDQDDTCVLLQHYSSAPNARSRRAVASPGEQGDALQRVRDRSEKLEAKLEQVQDTDARGAAEELYKGMREVQAVLQKYPNEDKQLQFRGDMRFYPATSSSGFTRDSARLHQEVMASWSWKAPTGQAPRVSAGNQESELVATRADAKAESKGGPLQVILGVCLIVCFCCIVLCAIENQARGVQRTPSYATGRSPQREQGVYRKSDPEVRREKMFNAQLMASIRRGSDQQGAASSPGWRYEQNTYTMESSPEPKPAMPSTPAASSGVPNSPLQQDRSEVAILDCKPPSPNINFAHRGNRTDTRPSRPRPSVTFKDTDSVDLEAAVAEQTDLRSQAVRDLQARLRNLHQEVSRGQRTPKESDHDDFGPSS